LGAELLSAVVQDPTLQLSNKEDIFHMTWALLTLEPRPNMSTLLEPVLVPPACPPDYQLHDAALFTSSLSDDYASTVLLTGLRPPAISASLLSNIQLRRVRVPFVELSARMSALQGTRMGCNSRSCVCRLRCVTGFGSDFLNRGVSFRLAMHRRHEAADARVEERTRGAQHHPCA
jgi:hypothetical protein